jgi:hypothetical protein
MKKTKKNEFTPSLINSFCNLQSKYLEYKIGIPHQILEKFKNELTEKERNRIRLKYSLEHMSIYDEDCDP